MLRIVFLIFGFAFLVLGCLLLFLGFAKQGINDGEWRNIELRGLPSRADQFRWSAWRPNDGTVYPFRIFYQQQPDALSEFRIGCGRNFFFDFTIYQGRFQRNGVMQEFPAVGPGWGASYHWLLPCLAFGLGGCLLLLYIFACDGLPPLLQRQSPV